MPCDANIHGLRYEAYCDNRYVGAADKREDVEQYAGCCDGCFKIVDTTDDRSAPNWNDEAENDARYYPTS